MTKEDYILLYLEDFTNFADYVYWEAAPCPILRELLLELGNTFLASCYILHFRIEDDPELKELIDSDPWAMRLQPPFYSFYAATFEVFIMNRI